MLLISIPYQAMLTLSYTLKASKYSATCILVTTCVLKTMHLFFFLCYWGVKKQVPNAKIAHSHLLIRKKNLFSHIDSIMLTLTRFLGTSKCWYSSLNILVRSLIRVCYWGSGIKLHSWNYWTKNASSGRKVMFFMRQIKPGSF